MVVDDNDTILGVNRMYNFNNIINRRGTNCVKWDKNKSIFGKEDIVSMWIADMDFEVSPFIIEEMQKVLDTKVFGYQYASHKYYEAIIDWMNRRHDYKIEKEWICYVPNVVAGLAYSVQAVSDVGDEIIIQTPVYGPFFDVIKNNGRKIIECEMKNDHGHYTMDLEAFESMITPNTKATILCNPHNPCGRVWTKEELNEFARICIKHNLYIISDDIHSELIYKDYKHTVIATLSKEVEDRCIICTSPGKAFNLASIHVANCIIKNEELRNRFVKPMVNTHLIGDDNFGGNAFAEAAIVGAYDKSEKWLDDLTEYLEENMDYFVNYIKDNIPKLKVVKPEGTYLVWIDCSELNMSKEELSKFLVEKCNIATNDGNFFGSNYGSYIRMNLACPKSQIITALEKIKEQIDLLNIK